MKKTVFLNGLINNELISHALILEVTAERYAGGNWWKQTFFTSKKLTSY